MSIYYYLNITIMSKGGILVFWSGGQVIKWSGSQVGVQVSRWSGV